MNRMTPENVKKLAAIRENSKRKQLSEESKFRLQRVRDANRKLLNLRASKKAAEKRQALLKAKGLLGSKFGFGW